MARHWSKPNPENATLQELETASVCTPTRAGHDRCRAIIALLVGVAPEQVMKIFNKSQRTLSRWIKRFNERGIDGLVDKPKPGRPRAISPQMGEKARQIFDNPQQAGHWHWTAVKFHGHLRQTLEIDVHYSTVVRFLHNNNYALKTPRPWPAKQDEALREDFRRRVATLAADPDVELWYADESGFEGDPRPRRRWGKKGQELRDKRTGRHLRMNVTGLICPRTGEAFLLEFTHSDTDVFQAFLDEANKAVDLSRKRQILILDNATWHKAKRLRWGRFEPLYLPPYSPDLNVIERLWLLIKAEMFTAFYATTMEQLIEQLDKALNWAIDRKELNKKTYRLRS